MARVKALRAMKLNYTWSGLKFVLKTPWTIGPHRGKTGLWIVLHDSTWMREFQQAVADGAFF